MIEAGSGHVVMGASKRGWLTWMVGAANSPNYPRVLGIIPLVPIVPTMQKDLHRAWMAYEGFSFAFEPYMNVGLLDHMDEELVSQGLAAIDPLSFQ